MAPSAIDTTDAAPPARAALPDVDDPPVGTLHHVAVASGQRHEVDCDQALSDIVDLLEQQAHLVGVLVVQDGRYVTALPRDAVTRLLSKPYARNLFLNRSVDHLLKTWEAAPLECRHDMELSDVIDAALHRPVLERYEPVVACALDGVRRLVDIQLLLLAQNRILQDTLSSLERQRSATRKAETEREALQAQLLEASRNAGRAEVATGILHNVGNVLNSVSVSRAMMSRKIEQSKVGNLGKAVKLLAEHRDGLGHFLDTDPRGRELPGYLTKVADVLQSEHAFLQKEMKDLGDNIEHIKQVVSTQQAYARARAVMQHVQPADLMDDAARLNALSFERHNVLVTRQYEEAGAVLTDRHKVLQILVNLISNAKNAVKHVSAGERHIQLRVCQCREGVLEFVRFVVEDNGVGIPPENATRIFSQGFTTREGGLGFGLHSAANFARELGGSLTMHSDGHGHGARFMLDLPAAAPPAP